MNSLINKLTNKYICLLADLENVLLKTSLNQRLPHLLK